MIFKCQKREEHELSIRLVLVSVSTHLARVYHNLHSYLFQEHCQTAVTHARSQAAAVRKTTSEYIKGELLRGERLTNGDPKW